MDNPLVSVNMITYNHKLFIERAIQGVLQQKVKFPFELVIGEDCSTDGTRDIVFKYQKQYPEIIHVITSDNNVGAKKNSLRTKEACRGKYVAFCEGDDYWHNPDKLQIQVDYLESHPECGMVFSEHDVYHVKSNIVLKDYLKNHEGEIPENPTISDIILGKSGIITCTVMIRRALCEQIVESDSYLHQSGNFRMGDIQVWAEAAIITKIKYIPESLATYSVLEESASHSKNRINKFLFWKSALEMILYLCDKHNLSGDIRDRMESDWRKMILRIAFYEKNADLATKAKNMGHPFTWKEWLWYYGAKNILIYYICHPVASLLYLIKKK